jgi:plasmid stabilization system protein ParE
VSARYDISPVALDDIDAAAAFIAEKDVPAAERFVDEVYDAFEMLARNPHLGHRRSDLTPLPVFFWTAFRSYAVISKDRSASGRPCSGLEAGCAHVAQ